MSVKLFRRTAAVFAGILALAGGIVAADHVSGINNIPVLITNTSGSAAESAQLPFNLSSLSMTQGGWMNSTALNTDMLDGSTHAAYMPGTGLVRMLGCFDDSSTDETDECNDATTNDITLPAGSGEVYEFAADNQFRILHLFISTPAVADWEIAWEYWNGSAWVALSNVQDGTNHFQNTGPVTVTWTFPAAGAWPQSTLNSVEGYWIRASVDVFTSVTQAPLGQQAGYETGRWWTFAPEIANQEQRRFDLLLGTGTNKAQHQYFPHADGVTVADDASLEPAEDNFSITVDGYIDTLAVGSKIVFKESSLECTIPSANTIMCQIFEAAP